MESVWNCVNTETGISHNILILGIIEFFLPLNLTLYKFLLCVWVVRCLERSNSDLRSFALKLFLWKNSRNWSDTIGYFVKNVARSSRMNLRSINRSPFSSNCFSNLNWGFFSIFERIRSMKTTQLNSVKEKNIHKEYPNRPIIIYKIKTLKIQKL